MHSFFNDRSLFIFTDEDLALFTDEDLALFYFVGEVGIDFPVKDMLMLECLHCSHTQSTRIEELGQVIRLKLEHKFLGTEILTVILKTWRYCTYNHFCSILASIIG